MNNIGTEVQIYNTLKERLKEVFDLEDDDEALLDTLDGETGLSDVILKLVRDAKRSEAFAEGMKAIIADNVTRKKRFEARADKLRALAAWAMQEVGLTKVEDAGMSVSQRQGKPSLVIGGQCEPGDTTPFTKQKTVYSWDLPALREAVEYRDPEALEIAWLSNAKPVLTIRTK
jgi:hypothetical protein